MPRIIHHVTYHVKRGLRFPKFAGRIALEVKNFDLQFVKRPNRRIEVHRFRPHRNLKFPTVGSEGFIFVRMSTMLDLPRDEKVIYQ